MTGDISHRLSTMSEVNREPTESVFTQLLHGDVSIDTVGVYTVELMFFWGEGYESENVRK